jgi:predicted metal-binding membrane protein
MWIVMMAAMMLPSVMHMVLGFIKISKQRNPNKSTYLGALFFVLGYFLIWFVFCVAMTALQWQLHELAVLTPMMESRNILFSALIMLLAGLYQFTAFKKNCLAHCREAHYLRDDCHSRPIAMGLHHGLYCVGACWALMLIMFAVGLMNLIWMGLITFMVVLEKIFPFNPVWLDYVSGLILVIWGVYLVVPPDLLFKL